MIICFGLACLHFIFGGVVDSFSTYFVINTMLDEMLKVLCNAGKTAIAETDILKEYAKARMVEKD